MEVKDTDSLVFQGWNLSSRYTVGLDQWLSTQPESMMLFKANILLDPFIILK